MRALDRPLGFAALTGILSLLVGFAAVFWARSHPESVLIGGEGRHDGQGEGRLAACLDCHVPFVGTPGSRCLGPGCHGELATGTPPRDGPAMPIRFHVALRNEACILCHTEHSPASIDKSARAFLHDQIPEEIRRECARCHGATRIERHARTNAVDCDVCHETERWAGVDMTHDVVAKEPCELCHVVPSTKEHASVAGACNECHSTLDWRARVLPLFQPSADFDEK